MPLGFSFTSALFLHFHSTSFTCITLLSWRLALPLLSPEFFPLMLSFLHEIFLPAYPFQRPQFPPLLYLHIFSLSLSFHPSLFICITFLSARSLPSSFFFLSMPRLAAYLFSFTVHVAPSSPAPFSGPFHIFCLHDSTLFTCPSPPPPPTPRAPGIR